MISIVINRIDNCIVFIPRVPVKHLVELKVHNWARGYILYRISLQKDISFAIYEGISPNEAPKRQRRSALTIFALLAQINHLIINSNSNLIVLHYRLPCVVLI